MRIVAQVVPVGKLQFRAEISVHSHLVFAVDVQVDHREHLVLVADLLCFASPGVVRLLPVVNQEGAMSRFMRCQILALFGQTTRHPVVFPLCVDITHSVFACRLYQPKHRFTREKPNVHIWCFVQETRNTIRVS